MRRARLLIALAGAGAGACWWPANSTRTIGFKQAVPRRARTLARCLLLVLAMHGGMATAKAPDSVPQHRVTFAFHSAFLMNLHHFLYDVSVHPDKLGRVAWTATPTPEQMARLNRAIDFYRVNYASLDLREDPVLVAIKRALSVDDARRDALGLGLPPALETVLRDVAPVYARAVWPRDDSSNRTWIDGATALDATYGGEVQAGIEQQLAAAFPRTPIRVDVVFDTGSRQGAYTDDQTVMPSSRPAYQGWAALEMLYHEASHTTVTAPLEAAIAQRLKATGRDDASPLWHVVQFYTVGSVTRGVLAGHGVADYQPYADQRGLYAGVWSGLMPAIHAGWDPHLSGATGFQQAVRQMVDALPAR